jgi:hypothetical protein
MRFGAWPVFPLASPGTIPQPPAGTFEPWMLDLCMGLAILALVFTVLLLGRQLFGRQPAIHVELETVSKRHKELEEKLIAKHAELEAKLLGKVEGCLTQRGFDEYRRERAEDILELKNGIAGVRAAIEKEATVNYHGRRRLHKQVNAHESAITWLAARRGQNGEEVRKIIAKGQSGDEEGEG